MPPTTLSARGAELATNPARIDFAVFEEASQNLYCPDTNPSGTFPLNIAENKLSAPAIREKIEAIVREQRVPDWVLAYTSMLGHPEVRERIAVFMEQHLCGCPINFETIGLAAGAAAIIEVSSFVLANLGDVVVIPAPAYPMYTKDLGLKSGLERYDLQTHTELNELGKTAPVTPALLDTTLATLKSKGKCFKILLLTSPDNPTGCLYTREQLTDLARWCIKHEIHLVVNEIYGLSLLERNIEEKSDYVSFAKLMHEFRSDYLHLWYAFSKDFAMSGLRIGVVHSLNEAFMQGFANANVPHMVSNFSQWLIGEILEDEAFVSRYIDENKNHLARSYALVSNTLDQVGLPYLPAKGSFFIWADFSKFLTEDSGQGEERLWYSIYQNTGVLLTPGAGFNHLKQGLFRIVFTSVPYAHLVVAMERLIIYLRR